MGELIQAAECDSRTLPQRGGPEPGKRVTSVEAVCPHSAENIIRAHYAQDTKPCSFQKHKLCLSGRM